MVYFLQSVALHYYTVTTYIFRYSTVSMHGMDSCNSMEECREESGKFREFNNAWRVEIGHPVELPVG